MTFDPYAPPALPVEGQAEDCASCLHFDNVGIMSTHEPGTCLVDGHACICRDDCTIPGAFTPDTRPIASRYPRYDDVYWRSVTGKDKWVRKPFEEAVAGERGHVNIGGVLIPTSKGARLMDPPEDGA